MATAELRLTAKDETQAAFSSVMSGLGRLEGGVGRLQGLFSSALGGLGLGLGLQEIFTQTIEAERAQARLESVLRSTGYAAGITAGQIEELAQQLKATTAFDDDELKAGMAQLLRFRDVSGDAFRDAAGLATDLAVAMSTDLASAFQTIGRLGQEPTETLKSLKGAGFDLKGTQLELAQALEDAGMKAQAQKVAFDELRRTIGGQAQGEASGLYGSSRDMGKAWGDMLKTLGQTPFVTDIAIGAMRELTKAAADVQAFIDADWSDKLRIAWKGAPSAATAAAAKWGKQDAEWGGSASEQAAEAGRRAREDEALWEQAKASDQKIGKWLEEQDRKRKSRAGGGGSGSAAKSTERAKLDRALELGRENYYGITASEEEDSRLAIEARNARELKEALNAAAEQANRLKAVIELGDQNYYGITASEEEDQRIAASAREMQDALKALRADGSDAKEVVRDLGLTFTSAFEEAAIDGRGLSEVIKGIEKDLIRVASRKLVTEPILGAASDLLDGFSLGKLFAGMVGSAGGNVMTSGGPLQLERFARGGVAKRPMLSLFGEGRQPEAYVPLPDGRSIPVTMQGGGAAGGDIHVSISVDARGGGSDTDPAAAAQQARAIAEGVRTVVRTELVTALRNGGILRR
jgi:hypothetical protein